MNEDTYYYRDGSIHNIYVRYKKLHRDDGPAFIKYGHNDKLEYEEWYIEGKEHRLDGPAKIWHEGNGSIDNLYYYIDGVNYSYSQWKKHPAVQIYMLNQLINQQLVVSTT
jgi:hypothetical protein